MTSIQCMLVERVEKIDTLSRDKRNHCGKALFCVFPPIPLFSIQKRFAESFLDNTSPFAAVCHGRVAAAAATTSRCCAEHTIDTSVC